MTKVRRIWTRAIDHVRRYPAISLLIIFTPLIAFHALGVAFDPNRAYVFNEYVSKFVPFMSNARLIDLFDGWAMGDPRPRLMNALATKANLSIREWVDARWILPPALGISWLIYCLVPVFVFLGARRLAGSNYVALAAALVWSTSPPAALVCDRILAASFRGRKCRNQIFPDQTAAVARRYPRGCLAHGRDYGDRDRLSGRDLSSAFPLSPAPWASVHPRVVTGDRFYRDIRRRRVYHLSLD